jgi:dsRNA-specific ribonuclease
MKRIKQSPNKQWPRQAVKTVECRKRDLVIRISDWTRQSSESGEPGYDVEVYVGGVYDWNESKCFTFHSGLNKRTAKAAAVKFAAEQISKLL